MVGHVVAVRHGGCLWVFDEILRGWKGCVDDAIPLLTGGWIGNLDVDWCEVGVKGDVERLFRLRVF